jgi:Putative antitoxin
MAAKTISLKQEAYDRLRAARRYPTESFSEVVLRATWPEDTISAGGLLALMRSSLPWFTDDELDAIETAKRNDAPPEDKWTAR